MSLVQKLLYHIEKIYNSRNVLYWFDLLTDFTAAVDVEYKSFAVTYDVQ